MKFYFYYILFLISILFSCTNKNNEFDVNYIFKRWKVEYVNFNDKKIENLFGENTDFDYEFLKDNTYVIHSPSNHKGTGKWELDKLKNCIYLKNERDEIYGKIIIITENKLVLIPTSENMHSSKNQLVEYHYKPK